DICFVYTFRTGYEKELRQGVCPNAASAMEMLAEHYRIPSINVGLNIVELETAGKLVFQSDNAENDGKVRFSQDGVHPLDAGHLLYTKVIADAVEQMRTDAQPVKHERKLAKPFVADHWQAAKMVPLQPAMLSADWHELTPGSTLAKSFGNRMGKIWEADAPGSKLTFKFRGSIARLYDLLAPDGGQVIVTIDGETRAKPIARFDSYTTYPRIATLSLAEGVAADREHTVTIEIHPEQPDRSSVAFRLKDPATELKSPKYQGTKLRASQILVLGDIME
ncbi:MAG TPA: SGNH/GDSL hydrolase family protein, partial [Pirellulaceae bacterium]|nr:SGNH/GDSL hydrolase family protein [Pirellulaceae bacterium]